MELQNRQSAEGKKKSSHTPRSSSDNDDGDANKGKGNANHSDRDGDGDEGNGVKRFLPSASRVDVHPLVLLSLVDHFARVNSKHTVKRRVAGLLLGNYRRIRDTTHPDKSTPHYIDTLDINNSFAVPFDEDATNPDVWFVDTNYAEEMFLMFKKVMPKVQVVGWYSSGPVIQSNDLMLHLLVADRFCPNPVYCVVNTDPGNKGVPVLAYTTVQGRKGSGGLEFRNIPTHLGAVEAEEIGIEHLLRDLTDSTVTTLSTQLQERELALQHLVRVLKTTEDYLYDVANGVMPISDDVLEVLQELVSLQPTLFIHKTSREMIVATNDQAVGTFVAAVARCVGTLHEVILNRRRLARQVKQINDERDAEELRNKEAEGDAATREKLGNEKSKGKEARDETTKGDSQSKNEDSKK